MPEIGCQVSGVRILSFKVACFNQIGRLNARTMLTPEH